MRDALRRLIAAAVGSIIGTGTVLLYRLHPPYPCVLVATIAGAVMYMMQAFAKFSGKRRAPVLAQQLFVKILFVGKVSGLEQVIAIVLGVFCGVVCMALLSTLFLPRSSTYNAMVYMKLSLEKLRDLCAFTMSRLDSNLFEKLCAEGESLEFETILCEIYNYLDVCMASLKNAKSEACLIQRVTKKGPRWLVFPGTHWFGESCICAGKLPYQDFVDLQFKIKITARHFWAVFQSISDMWDSNTLQIINQRYPQAILNRISQQCVAVMEDINDAFPSKEFVSQKNFRKLEVSVELLLNISNRWRTRSIIKSTHEQFSESKNHLRPLHWMSPRNSSGMTRRTALTRIREENQRLSPFRRSDSSGVQSAPTLNVSILSHAYSMDSQQVGPNQTLPSKFSSLIGKINKALKKRPSIDQHSEPLLLDCVSQRSSLSEELQLSPFQTEQFRTNHPLCDDHRLDKSSQNPRSNLRITVTEETRWQRRSNCRQETHLHTLEPSEGCNHQTQQLGDSSNQQLSQLDDNKRSRTQFDEIERKRPRFDDSDYRRQHCETSQYFNRYDSIDVKSLIVDVPLVEESRIVRFPESDKGQMQEMKWFAFQFQIDEMLESQMDLLLAENKLLQNIPKLLLTKDVIDIYH